MDFLNEEDIRININNNCGSPTQVPPGREGFIPASLLLKDSPTVKDKVVSLPRVQRQSRKAAENEEVSSQQASKIARKKNIKKPKPLKKPNTKDHLHHKSLHTILPEHQNQEVVNLVDSSPPKSPGPASELNTIQDQELEPEPKLEPIAYTLTQRVVVGNTFLGNTAQQVYVYGFRYYQLIYWINTIRKKHLRRFESTTAIQAAASYNQATKRKEVLIDLYSTKDINTIETLLEAWHSKKRKGLKVKVTMTFLKLPQILNILLNLQASTPDSSIQGLSNQIGNLLEVITG